MNTVKKRGSKTKSLRKLKWLLKAAWKSAWAWKRSRCREQRELDAFRKCVRLEGKLADYPNAVPVLVELERAYRTTGQEGRRIEAMRRLRDIEPRPVPDFMWDGSPPAKVVRNNVDAWCARVERFVAERRMDSIHLQHIQSFLHVSHANVTMVCRALEGRGVLGPHDMATGRRRVLTGRRAERDCNELFAD